jgi:predicted dehydrogenase
MDPSKQLSVGVIGVGFGKQVHVPAFRSERRCVVTGIGASSSEKARLAAKELCLDSFYGDWRSLLENSEIQAVSIAVPPPLQAKIAVAAVRAGKHIFCEKPVAGNFQNACDVFSAAESAGVVHAVDFIFPEIPAWQAARERIPELGVIRHVALSWRVETYAFRAKLDNWKTDSKKGGGTLNNFVSHVFYNLEWLFGPIAKITARLSPNPPVCEARVDAGIEFSAGFPASVSVAADAFLGAGHCLEIFGENGSLRLENRTSDYAHGFTLEVGTRKSGRMERVEVPDASEFLDGRIQATAKIVSRFIDAIYSGTKTTPNLREGLRVQRLMEIAREAHNSSRWQNVPEP